MGSIELLNDDLMLLTFDYLDLITLHNAGLVCRRWSQMANRQWSRIRRLNFFDLFPQRKLPKGKYLNKSLHYALKRCGENLRALNMHDPEPEFRFVKANENTFKIIGKYCKNLQEIDFSNILLLNDLLHYFVRDVDCSKIKRLNLNSSFNHYCVVYDGLSALYSACSQLEYLDISNSLNAKIRDCREPWPFKLTEVFIDNAWALTSYSLVSLAKCCPGLETFSMNGHMGGMDAGIEYVLTHCPNISKLSLRDYPGSESLGLNIGFLQHLMHLSLAGSTMACDNVIKNVARNCAFLTSLDCNLSQHSTESQRASALTDDCLVYLANYAFNLKDLSLNYRHFITDEGLTHLLPKIKLRKLSIIGCQKVCGASLIVLAERSCNELQYLNISSTNVNTSVLIILCNKWFQAKKTCLDGSVRCRDKSHSRQECLEIYADGVYLDFSEIKNCLITLSTKNGHNFTYYNDTVIDKLSVQLYSDMLLSIFS